MENGEDIEDKINQKDDKKINEIKKNSLMETHTLKIKVYGSIITDEMIIRRSQVRGKTMTDNSMRSSKFNLELLYRQKKEKELIKSLANSEDITKEKFQLAEKIEFKTHPDKIEKTDAFGFILEESNSSNSEEEKSTKSKEKKKKKKDKKKEKEKNENLLVINARIEKWNDMLNHFKDYQTTYYSKLKSRTRKGIPDSLRGYVWQKLCGADEFYVKDLYQKLEKEPVDKNIEDIIIKDLDRTFPNCALFKEKLGKGQRDMLKVLSNYSKYNKEVGYIQGMAFICALLLIYMDEERTFFMLHTLIKKYELEGIYLPGLKDLKKKFYVLLKLEKRFIPKCYKILLKDEVYPRSYASEWFICLFSRNLDFKVLVRIFDTFLLEGFKVIYRFSLAFIKLKEEELIKREKGVDSTFIIMDNCLKNVDVEELFNIAFGFKLKKKRIEKYEKEYEKVKDDQNNEFIAQM